MSYSTAEALFIGSLVFLLLLVLFAVLKAGREADEQARWEAMRARAELWREELDRADEKRRVETVCEAEMITREAIL